MDECEKNKLVLENYKLIWGLINQYYNYNDKDFQNELYEVGLVGLASAISTYDTNRGSAFSTYAYKYIRTSLSHYVKYLNRQKRDVKRLCLELDAINPLTNASYINEVADKSDHSNEYSLINTYSSIIESLEGNGTILDKLQCLVKKNFVNRIQNKNEGEINKHIKALDLCFKYDSKHDAIKASGLSNPRSFDYPYKLALSDTKEQLMRMLNK